MRRLLVLMSVVSACSSGSQSQEETRLASKEGALESSCYVKPAKGGAYIICSNSHAFIRDGQPGPQGEMGPQGPEGPIGPEGECLQECSPTTDPSGPETQTGSQCDPLYFFEHGWNGVEVVCSGECTPEYYALGLCDFGTGFNFVVTDLWYIDADYDGFGSPFECSVSCSFEVPGFVLNSQDCDDTAQDVNPLAIEVCNDGIDNNCNTLVDENCVN